MSRFSPSPFGHREIDLSWGGLVAANVAVLTALVVVFFRGLHLGLW